MMKKIVGAIFLALAYATVARAGLYVTQGPFIPPRPGQVIPGPTQVPGKEYTDYWDKDAANNLDPEQVILWDGVGGIKDGFDYTGSRFGDTELEPEVDALANLQDVLFSSVIADASALLFSVSTSNNIYYEAIPSGGGGVGIWATPPQIDQHGVNDLDALEVWGFDGISDANRYSLAGDTVGGTLCRTSVWAYDPNTHTSTPYIIAAQIAAAIGHEELACTIDLDAMMTYDSSADDEFGTGDAIMFSIAPIGPFDGGEIWVWQFGSAATFLYHGGHLWDTAFSVTSLGMPDENVNALEAVSAEAPEPISLVFFGTGIVGVFGFVARKRIRKT